MGSFLIGFWGWLGVVAAQIALGAIFLIAFVLLYLWLESRSKRK